MLLHRKLSAFAALLTLSALTAQAQESRGPVMPSFQQQGAAPAEAKPSPAPAAAAPDDAVDLVGPTDAQKARADQAAKAQAEQEAAARQRADEATKAHAEADARAKADADAQAQQGAAAQARSAAEEKARAKAEAKERAAADKKAKAEAAAQARADAIAARKAKAEAAAQARADAIAARKAKAEAAAQAKADAIAARKAEAAAKKQAAQDAKAAARAGRAAPPPEAPAAAAPAPAAIATPSDEGNADLVSTPSRRVIAPPGTPAPAPEELPPPPAYVPAPEQPAYAPPARAAAPPPAYPPPAAPAPGQSSAAPGYVDLAAHMREQQEAERAAYCARWKKKHRGSKKLPADCRNTPPPAAAADELPLTALDASAPSGGGAAPAAPDYTRAAPSYPPPAQPSYAQPAFSPPPSRFDAPAAAGATAIPEDERTEKKRPLRARDEMLIGPAGLFTNDLSAGGDMSPDFLAILFTYRFVHDDSSGSHHAFLINGGGAPCPVDGGCSFRADGLFGFSPTGRSTYSVTNAGVLRADSLNWSSIYVGANMRARTDSGWGFDAGAQFQSLSMQYIRTANSQTPAIHDASLGQLKLWAAGSVQDGGFGARILFQGNAYVSGDTGQTNGAQLRGVFYDTDLSGLASAPQALFIKGELHYTFSFGLTGALSYGFLSYAGPQWSNAHVIAARLAQEIGRHVQLGVGITEQLDNPTTMPAGAGLADYASLFVNAFISVSF